MQSPSPEVRRRIVPLLVAATAACASFPRAADDGGPPWIEVSTAHFRLATDMTERPAAETSRMLENWWAAMRAVVAHEHGLGDEPDGEPFLVVALRSQWEREGVHYELGGLFSTFDLAPPLISIGDISGQEGREALRHELAHAFLSRHLPRAPNWLNEGMAAYLQMAEVDGDGHTLAWGMRSSSMTRNYVDNGQRVSVGELLAPGPWAGNSLGALEFRAGLLVHMLINRRPAEFACYLSGLRTALDVDAPLKTCFPARDGWDREIDDYAYSTWFKSKTAPFEAPPVEPRTAPLADASVHAILALLDVAVAPMIAPQFREDRLERSRQNLASASKLEPAQLLAGLIELDAPNKNNDSYASLSRALVDAHPGAWRAWVARARAPGISADERQRATKLAWQLAPEEPAVLRLAAARALGESRWDDALALESKAWLKGAATVSDRIVLAVASARVGRCAEARGWRPASASEQNLFDRELVRLGSPLGGPGDGCAAAKAGSR